MAGNILIEVDVKRLIIQAAIGGFNSTVTNVGLNIDVTLHLRTKKEISNF